MPRMSMRTRGIVLAPFAVLLIAACTPPMPPDVLAARAESQIVCDSGTLEVAVPETFLGSMTAAGDALTSICPDQLIAEVADDQAAAMAVVDRTPTPTDITAFGAANCPVGVPIVVPAFGYPVSMAYNVPGLEGLVMTPETVAGILTGAVVSWDDPLLAEANPDFDLSGLPPISLMSVEGPQGPVEAMTAWTSVGHVVETIPQATGAELAPRVAAHEVTVVDVRNHSEFAHGHIPGALHIPVGYLTERLAAIPRDKPIVLQCQGGARSAIASSVLRRGGVHDIINLRGGFGDWEREGRAIALD